MKTASSHDGTHPRTSPCPVHSRTSISSPTISCGIATRICQGRSCSSHYNGIKINSKLCIIMLQDLHLIELEVPDSQLLLICPLLFVARFCMHYGRNKKKRSVFEYHDGLYHLSMKLVLWCNQVLRYNKPRVKKNLSFCHRSFFQ